MAAARQFDFDGVFFRGAKSDCDPGQVPLGYYWSAVNMLNQGGLLGCRPGYHCIVTFPEGKLQGAKIFRPKLGVEQIVVVIDGSVFVADYPFTNFRRLQNVQFSPSAKQIFFAQTEQSARRIDDSLESAIEVQVTKNVLIMQDGGFTAAAYYDGSSSGHLRDKLYQTPSGGPMRWIGDRLWVARGPFVYASDIANPLSFREQIYLGGTTAFSFRGDVTALAVTPSLEFPQLLVFTDQNASLVQANIRERKLWLETQDMSREVFNVGCVSQRSVVEHFGQLAWFSSSGLVTFDSAAASKQAARLPLRDAEMAVSKQALAEDLSLVAGAAFGSYILMSVPAEDMHNLHTWVLNNASFETLADASGPSWAGFWLGTRPVEWLYGTISGAERIYHVSADADGQNRLWEAFRDERLDNGCPILWAVETRGYFGMTSQQKPVGLDTLFCWADVFLTGIQDDLDVAAYFAGSTRGAFKRIASKKIKVARGSLRYDQQITADTLLFGLKPQSRKLRTEEARLKLDSEETGSCPVESDLNENIDESFQLLVVGSGPATIRAIRAYASPENEDQSADPEACVSEVDEAAVRFDGFADGSSDLEAVIAALGAVGQQVFSSNQTATVEQSGVSAVGIGFSENPISQAAADRAAQRIAEKQADAEVSRSLAPILSLGEGF